MEIGRDPRLEIAGITSDLAHAVSFEPGDEAITWAIAQARQRHRPEDMHPIVDGSSAGFKTLDELMTSQDVQATAALYARSNQFDGEGRWEEMALCLQTDPDAYTTERGDGKLGLLIPARRICALCVVRSECLEDALVKGVEERPGIRGGLLERERRQLASQRKSV